MSARILKAFAILTLPIILLFGSTTDLRAQKSQWTITPGIGHDQFEQSYFLEDTVSLDPDSLRALERTIEELKESFASLEAAYAHGATLLSNTFYATDAAARNVMQARTRLRTGSFRLDANGRMEWKGRDDRDSLSSSYLLSQLSLTPKYQLGDHWSLFTRGDFERTDYEELTAYGLDYDRVRARFGVRYEGELLESVELILGQTARDVSDSARLSYDENWIQADASYWEWGPTTWSMLASFRDRAYEEDGVTRNHQRIAFELSPRWQIRERTRLEGFLSWEYWDYAQDSGAYFDFGAGELEGILRFGVTEKWEVALDGRGRWEKAATEPFDEDDFIEAAVGPLITWRPQDLIWIEAAGLWGSRRYNDASSIYDDYGFFELDVRADGAIGDHITISLSGSYEQETHDDPTSDASYLYGSFGLRFPIRL